MLPAAARNNPNASVATVVGAACTLGVYIGSLFGWAPDPEIPAAITTLATAAVLAVGRKRPRAKAAPAPAPAPPEPKPEAKPQPKRKPQARRKRAS
jgi:predicted MFS family arabinose efflux permease